MYQNNFIIFTPKEKTCNTADGEITINVNKIEQVKSIKCLGVRINEHLSWTIHINILSPRGVVILYNIL